MRAACGAWGWACVFAAAFVATFGVPPQRRAHARYTIDAIAPDAAERARAAISSIAATPATPATTRSIEPTWMRGENGAPDVLVYPPRNGAAKAPVAVMLHGMCGAVEHECPSFEGVAKDRWLVCPRGNVKCEGAGSMWSWSANTSLVDGAVKRVAAAHPGEVAETNGMLIGFSWGAIAAVDVAQRSDGRWSSLVLVAADVRPDASLLRRAGVTHVYMGAGNGDMMKAPMLLASQRLAQQGIASTFVSTGDVGHALPRDMPSWVARAIAFTEDGVM